MTHLIMNRLSECDGGLIHKDEFEAAARYHLSRMINEQVDDDNKSLAKPKMPREIIVAR